MTGLVVVELLPLLLQHLFSEVVSRLVVRTLDSSKLDVSLPVLGKSCSRYLASRTKLT